MKLVAPVAALAALFSIQASAETIVMPDPQTITDLSNAVFQVTTYAGGTFVFYNGSASSIGACKKLLDKATKAYAEYSSSSSTSSSKKYAAVKLEVKDYTLSSTEVYSGTVKKFSSCSVTTDTASKLKALAKKLASVKISVTKK